MPDVTIIGAGPAGTVAACALAARGWDVTLVEQARFPRHKVCGESLSALGIGVLRRAGLAERVTNLGAVPLTRTALHAPDGRGFSIELPEPMWGVSRHALDAALLAAAREAGARVVQPARCERVGARSVEVRHLESNRVEAWPASWTLLADGKGALSPRRPAATGDLGAKAHFAGAGGARDAVELFGVAGHYVGVAPVEGGLTNVAFSVPAKRLREFSTDLDALWQRLLVENRALGARFTGARRAGDWLAAPLPRFAVAAEWADRVVPIGNAAAALEPIGGEGMGLAMRSAELAAAALDECERGDPRTALRTLRAAYCRLWGGRRTSCRMLAGVLSRPALAGPALEWAASAEWVSRAALRWIGKA